MSKIHLQFEGMEKYEVLCGDEYATKITHIHTQCNCRECLEVFEENLRLIESDYNN